MLQVLDAATVTLWKFYFKRTRLFGMLHLLPMSLCWGDASEELWDLLGWEQTLICG